MVALEHILACQCRLGEGPLWHAAEQTLYWVDIEGSRVHRLRPSTMQHEIFDADIAVTALGLRTRGGFVVATARGFGTWRPGDAHVAITADVEPDLPHNRFNDGAVDPGGRFWAGTMSTAPDDAPDKGAFYRLDPDGQVHTMRRGVGVSNGLGWSPDRKTMYYTDSPRQAIYAFDYDPATDALTRERVFVQVPDGEGYPDGLAVDSEGFVWSARWEGWKVVRHDPTGRVEREVRLPVAAPTSCAFGGPNLDELYITTAWTPLNDEQRRRQPQAGDLFRLQPGVRGQPVYEFGG